MTPTTPAEPPGGPDADAEPIGTATRCGFAAVLGAPNVGKSTLVNRLVGTKVSIVSPRVQTTRSRVLGIALQGNAQLILVDTPGVFVPRRRLDRAMVAAAWSGATDADILVVMVDAVAGITDDTGRILANLRPGGRPALAVLNKVDAVAKPRLLTLADEVSQTGPFSDVFMVSALTGDGVDTLATALYARLPIGPWLFPEEQVSDMPERLLAAEITREKLYLQLRQELPYASAVETERWTERDDGSVRIDQVIYVIRPNQKAIILGKGGQRIREIGRAARSELEQLLDRRVHLFLYVKVRDWTDDPERFRDLGLDYGA
ncbi:MAG: GTPase Era [Rhodospirillales bacterium]|nr:MAG: GTPase Era [Rhodospirillales bacterium]